MKKLGKRQLEIIKCIQSHGGIAENYSQTYLDSNMVMCGVPFINRAGYPGGTSNYSAHRKSLIRLIELGIITKSNGKFILNTECPYTQMPL